MKPILLKSLLFESIDYKVPASPNFLLYDFYVLSYIRTLNINPHEEEFIGRFNQPENLKHDIENAADVLLPHLKKHILDVLFFCICAEVRHFIGYAQGTDHKAEVREKHPVFDDYLNHYKIVKYGKHSAYTSADDYNSVPRITPPGQTRKSEYIKSWRAAMKAVGDGSSRDAFVRAAYDAFDDENEWEQEYGGHMWQKICDGWTRLAGAEDYNKISVAIDHIYDLHHNTGFVLNKIPEYKDSWVKKALDHKAKATDIRQLFPFCSSLMKKLALQTLRAAGHKYERDIQADLKISTGGKWEGEWDGEYWKRGTWFSGTWPGGIWERGKWMYGVWTNGTWRNGAWFSGDWYNGTWENGIWKDGVWLNGTWQKGHWQDGIWRSGTWLNGTWENGIWYNGAWKGGIWRGGAWKDGWIIYEGEMYASQDSPPEFYRKMEERRSTERLDPNAPGVITWPDGSKTQAAWGKATNAEKDVPAPITWPNKRRWAALSKAMAGAEKDAPAPEEDDGKI